MRGNRRIAAALAVLLGLTLTACAPALPETVIAGTKLTVGWSGGFTSTNAAASPSAGNLDIAEIVRADFGDVVDGEFVPDEGFGAVTIVSDDPFVVKYDLAEPSWSDGIPLDAADLLLGWAGAAGVFDAGSDDEADAAGSVPKLDEFARSIEVTSPQPSKDWQSAVKVPVPAHIIGQRAFDLDDAMEAKQAVIDAITDDDSAAIAKISKVWSEGFELPKSGELSADLRISSGPFLLDKVEGAASDQSVTVVPNPSYKGLVTPQVARIELVPAGDDPVTEIGERLDAAMIAPSIANWAPVQELQRKDFTVDATNDGTMWAVLLNPVGVLGTPQARTALIHAIPASPLTAAGSGEWSSFYTGTTSMTTAPGTRANDIVGQDSGFADALGAPGEDAALERAAAGVPDGAAICVLYDRSSEFASGVFPALQTAATEAGWGVTDCGSDHFDSALEQRAWDAVIVRVPIPQTPQDIAAQWGTDGVASITHAYDPVRDELIAQLEQTTDIYQAREVYAQIEATIVRAAVALPLAVNPRVTVIDRRVTGLTARNGPTAPLTSGIVQWAVVP